MSSSSASTSITDNAVQSLLDKLNNDVPKLMALLQQNQQNPSSQQDEKIQTLMSAMNQTITQVEELVNDNVSYGEKVYTQMEAPVDVAILEDVLVAGQQRFETVRHLAKESREAYLRQRKIMWLWVFLAVVLAAGAVYMYIWISGLGTGAERTLANPPDRREMFDTRAYSPSGRGFSPGEVPDVPDAAHVEEGGDNDDDIVPMTTESASEAAEASEASERASEQASERMAERVSSARASSARASSARASSARGDGSNGGGDDDDDDDDFFNANSDKSSSEEER